MARRVYEKFEAKVSQKLTWWFVPQDFFFKKKGTAGWFSSRVAAEVVLFAVGLFLPCMALRRIS